MASLFKINILQKVAPGLQKEGYEESAHAASRSHSGEQQAGRRPPQYGRNEDDDDTTPPHHPLRDDRLPPLAQPRPYNDDPFAAEPRRPFPAGDFPPPGFDDEYEINRPRGGLGGERRPLNIGERDLYPQGLGPHDPLRGGGFGPGGGGMHPTFDDPMFGGRGGGGGGGGGYDGQYVVSSIISCPSYGYVCYVLLTCISFSSLQGPARREIRSHWPGRRTSTGARRVTLPRWWWWWQRRIRRRGSAAESVRGFWR